jgi:hypothetical protein
MENLRRRAAQDVEKPTSLHWRSSPQSSAGAGQPGARHRAGGQGERHPQADD